MKHPIEKIRRKVFDALPDYSMSLPSGQFIGKVWKCDFNVFRKDGPDPDWRICEYVTHSDLKLVGIDYRIPQIVDD